MVIKHAKTKVTGEPTENYKPNNSIHSQNSAILYRNTKEFELKPALVKPKQTHKLTFAPTEPRW